MDNIFMIEMQTAGIQALESSYIVATSKNIVTIKGRQDFLSEKITVLKQGQNNLYYKTCIELVMEHYKKMYYDRPLQIYQTNILSSPYTFDLNSFYCHSLVNAMKKFCEEQSEEILVMKKETAKIKRSEKVLDTIKITKTELEAKCLNTPSYNFSLNELEKLENSFK